MLHVFNDNISHPSSVLIQRPSVLSYNVEIVDSFVCFGSCNDTARGIKSDICRRIELTHCMHEDTRL